MDGELLTRKVNNAARTFHDVSVYAGLKETWAGPGVDGAYIRNLNYSSTNTIPSTSCDGDWFDAKHVGLGCLKFLDSNEVKYNEAKQLCQESDSNLIEVQTEDQMSFLVSKLSSLGNKHWWGGASNVQNDQWYWENSQTEVAGFMWAPGQPNCHNCQNMGFAFSHTNNYYGNDHYINHNNNFPICQKHTEALRAIMVTGGYGTPSQKVEVLHANGSSWCSLPDLPGTRLGHSVSGREVCGGDAADSSCIEFRDGSWAQSHTLQRQRTGQSAWSSPSGLVLLGGIRDPSTTELLSDDSIESTLHFPLKYDIA